MFDRPILLSYGATQRIAEAGLLISARRSSALGGLVASLDIAVRHGGERIGRTVAAVLRRSAAQDDLLAAISCPAISGRYARYLLHAGRGYSVLALVWRPGQMSSVHSHKTWCALAVHRGSLAETLFRADGQALCPFTCRQHRIGSVSHASGESIHRIANLGTETAISIHVYGVPFDRLGHDVNQVWAE